eukprot:COSAG02_NODE_2424_length_8891_cov_566.577912_9_plen_377_part_01
MVYGDVTLEDEASGKKTKCRLELSPLELALYASDSRGSVSGSAALGQPLHLPLHAFARPECGGGELLRNGLANPFWVRAQVTTGSTAAIKLNFAGRRFDRDRVFEAIGGAPVVFSVSGAGDTQWNGDYYKDTAKGTVNGRPVYRKVATADSVSPRKVGGKPRFVTTSKRLENATARQTLLYASGSYWCMGIEDVGSRDYYSEYYYVSSREHKPPEEGWNVSATDGHGNPAPTWGAPPAYGAPPAPSLRYPQPHTLGLGYVEEGGGGLGATPARTAPKPSPRTKAGVEKRMRAVEQAAVSSTHGGGGEVAKARNQLPPPKASPRTNAGVEKRMHAVEQAAVSSTHGGGGEVAKARNQLPPHEQQNSNHKKKMIEMQRE